MTKRILSGLAALAILCGVYATIVFLPYWVGRVVCAIWLMRTCGVDPYGYIGWINLLFLVCAVGVVWVLGYFWWILYQDVRDAWEDRRRPGSATPPKAESK
jgi:hypothetical protein